MPALPSGTITFLFTDIEGSTTRWEQHPVAMRAALARHDTLLQQVIGAHNGDVVTERGEGDSFFALFARPTDAVAAACAVQQVVAAEPWPREVAPIRVRIALHTGEAGLWEGRDYRGSAVNRCARLRAIAHGGQVLLSRATYELVRDALPYGVTLGDLGDHRLKDLQRPEHVFQLVIPGLSATFPPLTSLNARQHKLPVQTTALIGREHEIDAVRRRLLDPQTRLLTLTGPGGTGKTRLSLQVAAEVLEAFPGGVYFVNLAPLRDSALVVSTIAQTLDIPESGGRPLRDALYAVLRDKTVLLVLDNFEQILDAAPEVAALLAECAQVRVLATSRTVLRLRGERVYAVPPLDLPNASTLLPAETLTQYESVRLFIERAQDVKPDFAVTNENAPAVAEICVRLDGLPLAIELAAARVKMLAPPTLLARLTKRLPLLVGGARDLPVRQQTLRDTIAWSYDLLDPAEQVFFRQLGVFVGGWTLEAAEAICANIEGFVLDLLGSLLDKSLVRMVGQGALDERYSLLETIREYALDRLTASGEDEAQGQAHAAYFFALAARGEAALSGPDQGTWLELLEREHDNLRAAMRWLRQRHHDPAPDRLLYTRALRKVGNIWKAQHHFDDAMSAYDLAERSLGLEPIEPVMDWWHEAVQVRLERMSIHYWMNQWQQMAALAEPTRELVEQHGTPAQGITFFLNIMQMSLRRDRFSASADAVSAARTAWTISQASEPHGETAYHRFALAFSLLWHGDLDEAEDHMQAALTLSEQTGDISLQARCLTYLGILYRKRGQVDTAGRCARRGLAVATAAHMPEYVGAGQANLAWVAWREGRVAEAEEHGRAALETWQQLPAGDASLAFQWTALWPLLAVALTRDHLTDAIGHVRALVMPTQQRLPDDLATLVDAAIEAWDHGQPDAAEAHLQPALELAHRMTYL